jgi:FtsH-binding integral membrane protein
MHDPSQPVSQLQPQQAKDALAGGPELPPIPEGCGILPIAENRLHDGTGAGLGESYGDSDRMEQTYRRVLARALGLCAGAMLLTAIVAATLVDNPGEQHNPIAGQIAAKAIFVTQLLFLAFCGRFIQKLSMAAAGILLFAYAAFCGLEFSALLSPSALAAAFLTAGLMYGATAVWSFVRGTDLARPVVPIFMILGGGLALIVVNLAFGTPRFAWSLSSVAVVVFAGLAGSHAQQIRDFYQDFDDDNADGWKASLVGALLLLLNSVNLYLLVSGILIQIASLLSADDEKESVRDNLPS